MSNGINVLNLCDGISCGKVALDRAGIKVNKYFSSEIDENACPSNSKRSSINVVGEKIYMNGYEYKNGVWKRTLAALFYNLF